MIEPAYRFSQPCAMQEVAKDLGLIYNSKMQDWTYEISNPESVEIYIDYYFQLSNDDKKFVLMEMIIQSVNDQPDLERLERYWLKIEKLLKKDFGLHEHTVYYWAQKHDVDDRPISSYMCKLWNENVL